MSRTSMEKMLSEEFRDYTYYKKKGWFDSDYFYPVKLNPFKKLTGRFFDWMASRMASA
jgi:coproporphyrinogen III oxidase